MITRFKDYIRAPIPPSDICIVGTGAAGMELVRQLNNSSLSITLIESGFEEYDWQIQKLGRFQQIGHPIRSADHSHYFGIEEAKIKEPFIRQFGGTLNIWGRRWKALEPIDFLQKPYISDSGWPISYENLYPYCRLVADEYGMIEAMPESKIPDSIPLLTSGLPCFSLKLKVSKIQKSFDIIKNFQDSLLQSSNTRLILGATAVEILLSDNLEHVSELVLRSLDGQECRVRSRLFILACGTIENTRLLLCSNSQIRTGIGNAYELVGRNLLDHPKIKAGRFFLFPHHKNFPEALDYIFEGGKEVHCEISLHPDLLKEWELPNHCMRFYRSALRKDNNDYKVIFFLEQLPNLESRIILSDERDELNRPIACLDWQFRDLDKTCFQRFVEKMKFLLIKNNIGTLCMDEKFLDMRLLKDASHHMGTTRMAKKPQDGVVDTNCKVFGIDNLYISGSSVFPSGGNANPTLTIFALARRLADHLKSQS